MLAWYKALKRTGGFGPVHDEIMAEGRRTFESERVSDPQTLAAIRDLYRDVGYVLDPHSAVGVAAALRSSSADRTGPAAVAVPHIALSTAHPAKFAGAVKLALKDEQGFDFEAAVLPDEFVALESKEKRVVEVQNEWQAVREIVKKQAEEDIAAEGAA